VVISANTECRLVFFSQSLVRLRQSKPCKCALLIDACLVLTGLAERLAALAMIEPARRPPARDSAPIRPNVNELRRGTWPSANLHQELRQELDDSDAACGEEQQRRS
jgi:hypothetical protein